MRLHKKISTFALASAVTLLGLAVPAFAEGGFTSQLIGVRTGFNSRNWSDGNFDAASTKITAGQCSIMYASSGSPVGSIRLQLTQDRANIFSPDINKGQRDLNCNSSNFTADFGRMSNAGYHFTVMTINGQASSAQKVTANYIYVSY
ncbi:hypothetical protein JT358_12800 [Micrococcales bacterium 31B]|nr:hypothetical protein [Micrococcales bacterium 31B]